MTREQAEKNEILRVPNGSTIHGLHLEGTDDRDEMGITIESLRDSMGISSPFEQFIYRSAAEREGKQDARSQPGDLDLTIFSLRKFLRLALAGNPTVLNVLFVPTPLCIKRDARGAHLQELAPKIVSKQAAGRYIGYLDGQLQRLLGTRGQKGVKRPELEEKYGFDTKYAMHILRLGYQGIEYLTTGRVSLPMPSPHREFLLGVRVGKTPLKEVIELGAQLKEELKKLEKTSPLPDEPDFKHVEEWMLTMYFHNFKAQELFR